MITTAGSTFILSAAVTATLGDITTIALLDAGGEFFRKNYANVTALSATKYQYEFYISESEGNGNIIAIELEGNSATTVLDSGTDVAYQALVLTKTNTQTLTILWTVELI